MIDKKFVNANWLIKASGFVDVRRVKKVHSLVGVDGLVNLVGEPLAEKMVSKLSRKKGDRTVYRLRRGLKITFYVK